MTIFPLLMNLKIITFRNGIALTHSLLLVLFFATPSKIDCQETDCFEVFTNSARVFDLNGELVEEHGIEDLLALEMNVRIAINNDFQINFGSTRGNSEDEYHDFPFTDLAIYDKNTNRIFTRRVNSDANYVEEEIDLRSPIKSKYKSVRTENKEIINGIECYEYRYFLDSIETRFGYFLHPGPPIFAQKFHPAEIPGIVMRYTVLYNDIYNIEFTRNFRKIDCNHKYFSFVRELQQQLAHEPKNNPDLHLNDIHLPDEIVFKMNAELNNTKFKYIYPVFLVYGSELPKHGPIKKVTLTINDEIISTHQFDKNGHVFEKEMVKSRESERFTFDRNGKLKNTSKVGVRVSGDSIIYEDSASKKYFILSPENFKRIFGDSWIGGSTDHVMHFDEHGRTKKYTTEVINHYDSSTTFYERNYEVNSRNLINKYFYFEYFNQKLKRQKTQIFSHYQNGLISKIASEEYDKNYTYTIENSNQKYIITRFTNQTNRPETYDEIIFDKYYNIIKRSSKTNYKTDKKSRVVEWHITYYD